MDIQDGHFASVHKGYFVYGERKQPAPDVEYACDFKDGLHEEYYEHSDHEVPQSPSHRASSPTDDDGSTRCARVLLLLVIVARTFMMIPRPGTATLAAAGIAAQRKGWDPTTDLSAVMFDALFTFFFTEVLLGAILAYYAACRLNTKYVFVALITSIMWVSVALNSQPEIISYWRHKFEHERAMNVLVAALRSAE